MKDKISIITPSFNQGDFIRSTIESVKIQNYEKFEHIIVDGGSSDYTLEILKSYPHLKWISEHDEGQVDAILKGVNIADGEIIAWLNSDDYYDSGVFEKVAQTFHDYDCNVVYGNITYVDRDSNYLYYISGDSIDYLNLINNPDIVRQPSFFWKKSFFEEVGGLDRSLHMVMDFDLLLRMAKIDNFKYINQNISFFRVHEDSKTQKYLRKQAFELYKVYKKNNIQLNTYHYKLLIGKIIESNEKAKKIKSFFFPKGFFIKDGKNFNY